MCTWCECLVCNVYVYVLVHVCVQCVCRCGACDAYTEFMHDTHMNHAQHITTMAKYISSPIENLFRDITDDIALFSKGQDVVVIQARVTKLTHGDNNFFILLLFVLIQALILEKGLRKGIGPQ